MIKAAVVRGQHCVGNVSLVYIAATRSKAVRWQSQVLFCSECVNCVSGKDFNLFRGKCLLLLHILAESLGLSVWQRKGDLAKRDLGWWETEIRFSYLDVKSFVCLTGDVYVWLLHIYPVIKWKHCIKIPVFLCTGKWMLKRKMCSDSKTRKTETCACWRPFILHHWSPSPQKRGWETGSHLLLWLYVTNY